MKRGGRPPKNSRQNLPRVSRDESKRTLKAPACRAKTTGGRGRQNSSRQNLPRAIRDASKSTATVAPEAAGMSLGSHRNAKVAVEAATVCWRIEEGGSAEGNGSNIQRARRQEISCSKKIG